MTCICYFDVFRYVNWFDAVVVGLLPVVVIDVEMKIWLMPSMFLVKREHVTMTNASITQALWRRTLGTK